MRFAQTIRITLLAALAALAGSQMRAQGPGGGGPGGPGGGMGMPGGGGRMGGGMRMPRGGAGNSGIGPRGGAGRSSMVGRWWDDRGTAKSLGLNSEQRKRMDNVFTQNRDTLQQRYDTFRKAQAKLEEMKRGGNASESELFAEIQRTSQARAELEQAYTHMQLQIRGELTPEQAGKLEDQH